MPRCDSLTHTHTNKQRDFERVCAGRQQQQQRGEGSRAAASPMLCEMKAHWAHRVCLRRDCARVCVSIRPEWGHLKVTGYYHLNIFLIMTITCSRSELSDTGRQAGVVDSYLETQCTEQFAVLSQTNWIWATLDWGPRLLLVWNHRP